MHLGSLISRLQVEDDASATLEALGDLVLFAEVSAAGAEFDETPSRYVAGAAARFAASASPEDWMTLTGHMERADDPGRAALAHMVRWSLDREAADAGDASQEVCGCTSREPDGVQP